jgi:glutamate racemase
VTLVGSKNLAGYAEAEMAGEPVADAAILSEIEPCFVEGADGRRTDVVCLSCTHYPLLLPRFERLAPWPVTWIDPAPAIARRVIQLVGEMPSQAPDAPPARAVFTGGAGLTPALGRSLERRGLFETLVESMPLAAN